MKKIFTLILSAGFISNMAAAQQSNEVETDVFHKKCDNFRKTLPLRELLKFVEPIPDDANANAIAKDHKATADWSTINDHGIPENNGIDPIAQFSQGTKTNAGMKANWQALGGSFPPDPSGAAGPEHYVQAVNVNYRVYNKDGSTASSTFSLGSLFGPGVASDGDPIVMYDRYADRWFISQFQTSNNGIYIAVSESSDPLGAYYTYNWTYSQFPDYPKFGVWSNGYYMSANSGNKNCVIFEREKMLLGDPNASMISMTFPSMPFFFRSFAPIYAEGPTEPGPDDPFYFFHVQDDSWSGVGFDHIKTLKCTVDWANPSNSDINIDQQINISSLNTVFTSSWNDIAQPGSSQKLDAVAGIFLYRVQYRKFADYNVALMTTTADVNNSNRAGVRWIELRENNDGVWYLYQEGTYSPGSSDSRWLASAAMDLNGNIGMAYSFIGPNDAAGIRYTGRYADDPLGEMTVIEQIAVEGAGAQSGGNRYGDYSQMTVDPTDDATFWFTGEYISAGNRRTRVFSFAMWELLGADEEAPKNPFFNAYQPNADQLKIIWKDLADENLTISVLDMNGKLIKEQANINANVNQLVFDMPANATGIYIVKLTGANTNLSERVFIAK